MFRSPLYLFFISYDEVGKRDVYAITNKDIINCITKNKKERNLTFNEILSLSHSITNKSLYFTPEKNHLDPNLLYQSKSAHCIGYAGFFSAICNFLLIQNNLEKEWEVTHSIGEIYVLDCNIHDYFETPFFKDHDFVKISNKETNKIIAIDPTVSDYLGVQIIRVK